MRVHLRLRDARRTGTSMLAPGTGWATLSAVAAVAAVAAEPAEARAAPDAQAVQGGAVLRTVADIWTRAGTSSRAVRRGRSLRVGGRRHGHAFLRFDARRVSAPPLRAELRVFVRSRGARRLSVLRVRRGRPWSERRGVPRAGRLVRRSARLRARRWIAIDVTAVVRPGRRIDLALAARGARAVRIAGRASRRYAPRLVLQQSGPGTGAPGGSPPSGGAPGAGSPAPGTAGETALAFPIRAAFYYPWFPETWTVSGRHVFYRPTLGYYSSDHESVADAHVRALDHAKIEVAIASWWGPGEHKEGSRIPMLMSRTGALGSALKWTVYYEPEGSGDPSPAALAADLAYLRAGIAGRREYARIDGRPVVFVWNPDDTSCEVADRWGEATAGAWYVVLKVFSGYASCATQPDAWHQYGPASPSSAHNRSYTISPGYWQADETAPRLARDVEAWRRRVREQVNSGKPWQLITTFNEWGEGTAVESAEEWSSASGYGAYLDALRTDGN